MERTRKILENQNIILRKEEPEDLEFLYSIENDDDFWFVSDTNSPFSKWQIKQHIENSVYDIFTSKELRLIIELKKDKSKLGIVDLFEYAPQHARIGIGIVIAKEQQNKNIGKDALELAIDYCFRVLETRQIWCNIDANNSRSIKLLESVGFRRNGILKDWKRKNNVFSDVYFYQNIGINNGIEN